MMNILIITNHFWPEQFRINDLANGLKNNGHKITVMTGTPNYPQGTYYSGYGIFNKRVENFNGITIKRFPVIPRGKGSKFDLLLNYFSLAVSACLFAPIYSIDDFDLIFVFETSPVTIGLPALIIKKIKKIPIIFWVQDLWPESIAATKSFNSDLLVGAVNQLVKFIYSGCDKLLVQSRGFSPYIVNQGVNADKIVYFPNSAEDIYESIVLEKNAPEHDMLPKGFRIIFAGNLGVAQDFETIIAAAEVLRQQHEIQWIIIGDGRMRPWVEQQIKSKQLENTVHLIGEFPVSSMPRFFSLADALLVTLKYSPIFSLTIPSKIQSYLACSKPIIAALDGEGAKVINESGAGIVVPPEEPITLAAAAVQLFSMDSSERRQMGHNGKVYFDQNFNRKKLLGKLEAWMDETVTKTSS